MRPIGQAGRLRPSDPLRPVQVRCWLRYSLVTRTENRKPKTDEWPLSVASCDGQRATDNLQFIGQGSGFRPRSLRHGAPALC